MPIYAVTDKLFFADKKAAEDPELLKMHGITHILSVAGSPKKCQDIQYLQFKFPDDPQFDIRQALVQICNLLGQEYAKPNNKFLVHCMGGLSRSPSVVVGILIMLQGVQFEQARQLVVKARPSVQMHFSQQLKQL